MYEYNVRFSIWMAMLNNLIKDEEEIPAEKNITQNNAEYTIYYQ